MANVLKINAHELKAKTDEIETVIGEINERLEKVMRAYRGLLSPEVWNDDIAQVILEKTEQMGNSIKGMVSNAEAIVGVINEKVRENLEEEDRFRSAVENSKEI